VNVAKHVQFWVEFPEVEEGITPAGVVEVMNQGSMSDENVGVQGDRGPNCGRRDLRGRNARRLECPRAINRCHGASANLDVATIDVRKTEDSWK